MASAGRTSIQARPNMKLNSKDLAKITDFTLSRYNEHAEDFWEGTRDHNVNQNITALLQSIESEPPYTILDFGCGPGREGVCQTRSHRGRVGRRLAFRRDGARP